MNLSAFHKKVEYLLQAPTLAEGLIDETVRRVRLMALQEEELNRLCHAEFDKRREDAERWRFYNQPRAVGDLELLGKVDFWKGTEAAALLLGKDPYAVPLSKLKEFEEHDKQALEDFLNLEITGVDLTHYLTKQYTDLVVMLSRAEVFLPGTRDVDPASVLNWATAKEIPIPALLKAALEGRKPRTVQALPAALAEIHTPEPQPAPVVDDKRRKKKPSIESVALDYMRKEYQTAQFQSAAKFHKHLIKTAGLDKSPFEMGTGINARKLFCPAASSFFDEGTLGKMWAKIRAA